MPITLQVCRSLDRILKIGANRYRLIADDWQSIAQAEDAAGLCALVVNHADAETEGVSDLGPMCLPIVESLLGELARRRLGVDDSAPFGFNILLAPA